MSIELGEGWFDKAMTELGKHYQPTCPYCGHQENDCEDVHRTHTVDDSGAVKVFMCNNCEKEFRYRITVTERYDSYRMEEEIDE
jgi:transcription elongation factor Elf1